MDITVTLECNNNCLFCPRQSYLSLIASQSKKELYQDIRKTRAESDKIVLSGGEVTLMPDVFNVISFCREQGFRKIGIITNARNLRKAEFAEKLVKSGVSDWGLSLYSLKLQIHDRITQVKGSCTETKKGIKNMLKLMKKYSFNLRVNLVLNFWNQDDIFNTLEGLTAWGVKNFIIAEEIMINKGPHLSLRQISRFLEKIEKSNFKGVNLCLRGFAPCLLKKRQPSFVNDKVIKRVDPRIIMENYELNTLVKGGSKKEKYLVKFKENFLKFSQCSRCIFFKNCLGLQKGYFSYEC